MNSVLRMTAVASLLSTLGTMVPAHAGLGPIRVLSAAGEPFEAEIPLVEEFINANALIGLADRNRYPLISPYSPSVGKLQFSLVRQPDGTLTKVHVAGPADFDEATLNFAVEISWPAGRLVREFEVDHRRDGPRHPKRQPLSDGDGKKAAVTADHLGRLAPLGLGELKVQSFLGEPLLAEVEVLGRTPADLRQLSAVVLSRGDTGPQRAQLVASIGHEFVKSASGTVVLRLYSTRGVEEPALPLRLEVGVGTVKVARNYLLLLNPVGTADEGGERSSSKEGAAAQADAQAVRGREKAKIYRVAHGDTLTAIAQRTKGGGSVGEVVRWLHAANPAAFVSGDVNKLKAGARLAYPSQWRIAAGFPDGARAEGRSATGEVPAVRPPVSAPDPVATPSPEVAAVPAAVGEKAAMPGGTMAREEQLQRRLQQQDQLLAAAEKRLQALQQRVKALQEGGKGAAPALSKPGGHVPLEVPRSVVAEEPAAKAESGGEAAGSGLAAGVSNGVAKVMEENASYLYSAGAAGVALLGGGWWLYRRRKARKNKGRNELSLPSSQVGDSPSLLTMGPLTTLMAGGKQGGGIDLSPVDRVAEAEVYLAYGRTDQALELLREELSREPMRQDVRFKLLEALSTLPDKQAFIIEATAAKGVFGKDSTLWQRVCELGRVMLPDHPLFGMAEHPRAEASALPLAAAVPAAGAVAMDEAPGREVGGSVKPTAPTSPEAVPPAKEAGGSDAPDKRELAKLYLEMGDVEAAKALLGESEDSA
ncbi:MAG: pilus assembly protein FimV [Pseudogulbenkiania sp.]|nr:pilus assembly protein FimV [Pseudogulbenkiania sp.]